VQPRRTHWYTAPSRPTQPNPTQPPNRRSAAVLRGCGCDVGMYQVVGKGHEMVGGGSRQEAQRLLEFYAKVLAAAPPDPEAVEIDPRDGPSLPLQGR